VVLLVAMQSTDQQWSAYKFARMHPVTSADHPYYIDAEPESLQHGADGLFGELTGISRMDYVEKDLVAALAGSKECPDVVAASPARCITAIEARLYCESNGKRLPTPEEWTHAMDAEPGLRGDALGEWTMRMVHGTATFEVSGSGDGVPDKLEPAEFSRQVGFRCAFSFDE
jgi:formylglycine-generating enzyme required for sulfatase activity